MYDPPSGSLGDGPLQPKVIMTLQPYSVRERKERTMEWTSPQFEEICLNCEINSYANAEL
jgi:coenzyme PQQ precursor peptide PqqA